MREKYPEPMTVLEWLRRPPRKRSRKTLDEEISKWLVIRAMTLPSSLDRIPAQRLRAYARRMRRRRPIKVREIAEPRRTRHILETLVRPTVIVVLAVLCRRKRMSMKANECEFSAMNEK
jgi:hypothetical protein